jgi:uncharacterized repeat protein (TIGR03803 family)
LIQGTDGNFYGVTVVGGNQVTVKGTGAGTIFRIGPSGFTTLYRFCAQTPCVDGAAPAQLIQAANADLYGVTTLGGAITSSAPSGSGTVFKLTPAGTLTTLHAFCAQTGCPDGARPTSLIQGSGGNFYGAAEGENTNTRPVLRITPDGTFTVLYNLVSYQGEPLTLTQGTDGAFYGTTWGGGKTGRGGIFRLDIGLGPFVQPVLTFGKGGGESDDSGNGLDRRDSGPLQRHCGNLQSRLFRHRDHRHSPGGRDLGTRDGDHNDRHTHQQRCIHCSTVNLIRLPFG